MSDLIEEGRRWPNPDPSNPTRPARPAGAVILDLAMELAASEERADDLEDRLSAYLCDSTGGLLSNTGYDVRTMVTHTEEYYQKVAEEDHASHCGRAEAAEAKLTAIAALHCKREIYPLDTFGAPDMDAQPIAFFCEACTPDETVRAIEDAEWSQDDETAYWPCDTARALGLPAGGEH